MNKLVSGLHSFIFGLQLLCYCIYKQLVHHLCTDNRIGMFVVLGLHSFIFEHHGVKYSVVIGLVVLSNNLHVCKFPAALAIKCASRFLLDGWAGPSFMLTSVSFFDKKPSCI